MSPVDDRERLARAALARVLEPGHRGVFAAVAEHGAQALWSALRGEGAVPVLSTQLVAAARHRAQGYDPARDLAALEKIGARQICPGDEEWPAERLAWEAGAIDDEPPLSLHARGRASLGQAADRAVAVVGARIASPYGLHVARELGLGLADRGWTVVSGAAYGIDGAAHEGALLSGGAPTVAVLACGLDRAYPAGHTNLLRRIVDSGGLVVSELPVGSAPTRSRFLVRNRLIAALSAGTVVVEAAARSGSLATVGRAAGLSRAVMAVPGPVTSAASAGTNDMLRGGAVCVTSAADVVTDLGRMDAQAESPPRAERGPRDDLSAAARAVLDAVPVRSPAGVASIARAAGVSPLVVQQVLPPLVLHGLVEQKPDGFRLTPLGMGRPPKQRQRTG